MPVGFRSSICRPSTNVWTSSAVSVEGTPSRNGGAGDGQYALAAVPAPAARRRRSPVWAGGDQHVCVRLWLSVGLRHGYLHEMVFSQQDPPFKKDTRANQKTRTRAALLQAATDLFWEGRSPSMPETADRALVSVATAYRYFSSVEDLWWEATLADCFERAADDSIERTKEAGPEPRARLETAVRSYGFAVLDDQAPFRRIAQIALERWFRQRATADEPQISKPSGPRGELVEAVLSPLASTLPEGDRIRIAHALALVLGTEAVIALTDAVGLDVPAAKGALLDASRWLLAGALAELTEPRHPAADPNGPNREAS